MLLKLHLKNVHKEDLTARVNAFDVGPDVGLVPRSVLTVGALKSGRLIAFKFLMIGQITFASKDASTVAAGKTLLVVHRGLKRSGGEIEKAGPGRRQFCENKKKRKTPLLVKQKTTDIYF